MPENREELRNRWICWFWKSLSLVRWFDEIFAKEWWGENIEITTLCTVELISRNLPFEFRQIDIQYKFSVKSWFDGIFSKPYFTALILLRKFRQFIFIIKERYSTPTLVWRKKKKTIYVDGSGCFFFSYNVFPQISCT